MSLVTIMSEFLRFIKNNLLKIALIGLLFGILTGGARFFLGQFKTPEQSAAYEDLAVRYEQEPAEFQMVITNVEGQFYNNSYLLDEVLSLPAVVTQIEQLSGVKFAGWIENETLLELSKSSSFRGALAGLVDRSSEIITIRVAVGKTAEENLKIAQAYEQFITSGQLPFLESYNIALINTATIGERLPEDKYPRLATLEQLQFVNRTTPRSAIIFGIVGVIAGSILGTIALLALRLLKQKIAYVFDYAWDFEDTHFVLNGKQTTQEVLDFIQTPPMEARVTVVSDKKYQVKLNEQSNIQQVVTTLSDLAAVPQEIILLVVANQTEKAWYQHQYRLAKMYRVPVKVIQMNEVV